MGSEQKGGVKVWTIHASRFKNGHWTGPHLSVGIIINEISLKIFLDKDCK